MAEKILFTVPTVHEEFEMRKIYAHWVPHPLTEDHTKQRMAAALDFLTLYTQEGEELVGRIITDDETWIHYCTPLAKK